MRPAVAHLSVGGGWGPLLLQLSPAVEKGGSSTSPVAVAAAAVLSAKAEYPLEAVRLADEAGVLCVMT